MLRHKFKQKSVFEIPFSSFGISTTIPQKWVSFNNEFTDNDKSQHFSLMSYNILAESNIRADMYPNCTKYELKWENRYQKICQ